jgi:tRNA nucleotidyltransferase (CCA-adding enzyme)
MEIITSHENTDFDGLASILAAAKLYPKAIPVLPQRLNRNLRDFLTLHWDELPFVRREDLPRGRIKIMILVDTQSIPSLRGLSPETKIRFIDHHLLDRKLEDRMSFHGGEAGSTTTLLADQICQIRLPLSPVEATLLLLGVYEDTGSLTYPDTRPVDVRCAAWLLEQGANLEVVNEFLHRPLSDGQRELYQKLIEVAEFHEFAGQTVVIASTSAKDYLEEIAILAHKLRDLYDPAALFLIIDLDSRLQMVARSSSAAIDVAEIARHFGGGGHGKAAAALIKNKTLGEARQQLLELLEKEVRPVTTVKELMSHGVHTLSPETSVAEAEEMMRRYGHEGFPVVADGQLLGILTRREIDKALQYQREDAPIKNYMHKGEIAVSPSDPVEYLQEVMMEHDLGQVPVVENGEIVGIVTRTDLIKLWSKPWRPSRADEMARRVREALPPRLLDLILKASQVSKEMGYSLYFVGGFVRDLLLDQPHLDIDLVVEGDAIALAKRLSGVVGGRVHSHDRFGTAKLIFKEEGTVVPFIDFVTARREFYEYSTALPQVERSSIKQDLYRRDFTINTMAISLDEDSFGELLDYYGGERDLEEGLIRVLHNLSFIEDPIRMLRAVRLEQRLGFRIEAMTEELISDALEWLDRVSGERIRQELDALFQEEELTKPLRRLTELAVLSQIHPILTWDAWMEERVNGFSDALAYWRAQRPKSRPAADMRHQPSVMPYLALISLRATVEQIEALAHRLKLPKDDTRFLLQAKQLGSTLPALADAVLLPSRIYQLLWPFSDEVIFTCWLASEDELIKQRLELYHKELASVEPLIDGDELKEMGLTPGPLYGEILGALRDARLDGKIKTPAQEKALVQHLMARQGTEMERGA